MGAQSALEWKEVKVATGVVVEVPEVLVQVVVEVLGVMVVLVAQLAVLLALGLEAVQ